MHENRVIRLYWFQALVSSVALTGLLAGCASLGSDRSGDHAEAAAARKEDADVLRAQLTELRTLMISQGNRLDSMETRLGSLGDKVTSNQVAVDNLMSNRKAVPTPVNAHPSEGAGTDPQESLASDDPEAGFIADAAIQEYRKGTIFIEARKYPEAVLAFTTVVEKYPDHPLAGSAQFNIGEAYFKQKEYKLALHEFERVLTSYDRSPHVSDTLRDLAEAEDALKMHEQAARHRQLLSSLFSQSPAASASPPKGTPVAMPHLDEPPPSTPATASASGELPTAPLSAPEAR